jgi:hypothetical protein
MDGLELEALLFTIDVLNAEATLREAVSDALDQMITDASDALMNLIDQTQSILTAATNRAENYQNGAVDAGNDILSNTETTGSVVNTQSLWIKIVGINPGTDLCRLDELILAHSPTAQATTLYSDVDVYIAIRPDNFAPISPSSFGAMGGKLLRLPPVRTSYGVAFAPHANPGLTTAFQFQGTAALVAKELTYPIPLGKEQCTTDGFAVWAWIQNSGATIKGTVRYTTNKTEPFNNTGA